MSSNLASLSLAAAINLNVILIVSSCRTFENSAATDPESEPGIERIVVNDRQAPAVIHEDGYARATPDNVRIRISLNDQRAYVYAGDELLIDTPVATGSPAHPTPTGSFKIMEKKREHASTLYGDFVDASGKIVRAGVDSRRDAAPPGSVYRGTAVPYWQRLTSDGVGMHVGMLPGYAASHGCIRFPAAVQPRIYEKTRIGTPVTID